jgi:hypothetical protein
VRQNVGQSIQRDFQLHPRIGLIGKSGLIHGGMMGCMAPRGHLHSVGTGVENICPQRHAHRILNLGLDRGHDLAHAGHILGLPGQSFQIVADRLFARMVEMARKMTLKKPGAPDGRNVAGVFCVGSI